MDFYYNPADYGLTPIGEIDWSDGSYQFDLTVVWQDREGRFWRGDDSGCSCPTPFEDTALVDLVQLTSLEQFKAHCVTRFATPDKALEIANLLEKLHAAGLR